MNDPTEIKPIQMTRKQAEAVMKAINHTLEMTTFQINAIQRKRSWRPAERAVACVPYAETQDAARALRKLIGTAFNLGGY